MGFAQIIESKAPEKYRQYYLQYTQLKDLVKELAQGDKAHVRSRLQSAEFMEIGVQPIGRFQGMLRVELQKVNQFACVKHEALFLGLRRLCDDCRGLGKKLQELAPGQSAAQELKNMEDAIQACSDELVHLDQYVRLNYVGFQRITQKFDRCLGISGSALFVAGLHTEPFCNVRFDDILVLQGLAWMRWNAAQNASAANAGGVWKPPESFVRQSSKYWVRPEQVVLLKTRIMKHLPYLIFGFSEQDQEKLLEPFALLDLDYAAREAQSSMSAYAGTLEESQLLSSVYFDSKDARSYIERIRREEGARLVRFRWYGENNLEPELDVYVERKIHREGFGGGQSAKERAEMKQKDMLSFMSGTFDIDDFFRRMKSEGKEKPHKVDNMNQIAQEVSNLIQDYKMQPIIRTSYYRCAFQRSDDNKVRVSLDTQLSFLNEFREAGHKDGPWCHIGTDQLTKDDVYRFPFAILEIKLQNVPEPPQWLKQTLADIEAIQVHKFSKFQHAMAFLHPEKVPILPHWHQDFKEWHDKRDRLYKSRKERKTAPNSTLSCVLSSQSSLDGMDVPQVGAAVEHPRGEGHVLKDMKSLDPKGVFANERTLLHYAEKGMYVGALAVMLLHQPGRMHKVVGGILSLSTGVFYVWALYFYYVRLDFMVGRQKVGKDKLLRLDWVSGPVVVGALIMLVLAISLAEAVAKGARWLEH